MPIRPTGSPSLGNPYDKGEFSTGLKPTEVSHTCNMALIKHQKSAY
ncbi:hypothetical protein PCH70_04190 [Pseudomonas cichorii JBC1]|nr:hypothetical protein PCH70_04190 [Pseudomonas cichorii JBC1]